VGLRTIFAHQHSGVALESIHNRGLTKDEREAAGVAPYINPALRGARFLVALVGVSTIGAGIVIYFVLRHATAC
jgi:hypothetical protein